MIGKTVSHYRILKKIGAGGMGEVYLAEDTKLDRKVALKFLPAQFSANEQERKRFIHEAKAAAALNHPNIITVHETGEHEGQIFIAMEYVAGKTLKELISSNRLPSTVNRIPIPQVLDISTQLASGLAAAHAKGIVHRDLKPANIMLTEQGQAKIVDFGLAKLKGMSRLTRSGTTLGTVAYMSPEQAMGKEVDHRTDIWSLGVVLYEILAGALPFRGDYEQAIVYSILNEEPLSLATARGDIPDPLQRIIHTALAKNAKERYQSSADLLSDLKAVCEGTIPLRAMRKRFNIRTSRTWKVVLSAAASALALLLTLNVGGMRTSLFSPGTAMARSIRLAVLPFANLSGDPEQEYFSDGLTQEMITQLGRLHPQSLNVIARTSVMRYKTSDTPIDQIGRDLNVEYILEGSARREGNWVKVTAELVRVKGQTQLWAETYERELSGILALQNEVAAKVAGALILKLLPSERTQLTSTHTVNPEAYEAYLKGSFHWNKLRPGDLDTAQHYFELALQKAPAYAPAYAGLACVWSARQRSGVTSPREAGPKAKEAALKAIALDDHSAEAHEALAIVKTWIDWDWVGAELEWQRALALNPNEANTHAYYAHFLANMGRANEAVTHSERAIKLDPFNALYHSLYSKVLMYLRRYEEAFAAANAALALQPDSRGALSTIQHVYIIKGMRDEQLVAQRKRIAGDPERLAAFEQGLAEGGYEGAQRRIAALLAERYEKSSGVPDAGLVRVYLPCAIALRYFDAGDHDRAIDWLEKAYEERDPILPYSGEPLYDPLRANPRFRSLLKRIGLPSGEVQ